MFKSILPRRNTQAKSGDNNSSAMDTSEEETSFVHVHDENINIESLSLKLTPRYDVIGTHVHKKSTQFCATVTARDLPDDDSARAPVDIVVALDVSSSMSGAKLELCKTTLSLLLRELNRIIQMTTLGTWVMSCGHSLRYDWSRHNCSLRIHAHFWGFSV